MRRTPFAGGLIVDVGAGLDGDEMVDCTGRAVLPGMVWKHGVLVVNP